MNGARSKGMILVWVIVALSLVATAMLVLAEGANTLLLQADAAHCRAVERNLTASGVAWAQVAGNAVAASSDPVRLDSVQIGGANADLTVEFVRVEGASADVLVRTACVKGRQSREQSHEYAISRP